MKKFRDLVLIGPDTTEGVHFRFSITDGTRSPCDVFIPRFYVMSLRSPKSTLIAVITINPIYGGVASYCYNNHRNHRICSVIRVGEP